MGLNLPISRLGSSQLTTITLPNLRLQSKNVKDSKLQDFLLPPVDGQSAEILPARSEPGIFWLPFISNLKGKALDHSDTMLSSLFGS